MRDVRLTLDGAPFRHQFGAFAKHLGDSLRGAAGDGDGPGANILGQSGFRGRTYVLTGAVPETESYVTLLAGLGVMGVLARRRARRER